MANTFYSDACNMDAKMTPFPVPVEGVEVGGSDVNFWKAKNKEDGVLSSPHSIMNENVAINYRTIYNGYASFSKEHDFTEYDDYLRCMSKDKYLAAYLRDKKNPTYKNIISYYSDDNFDPHGLATYRMQDFIYLKYYNQIPNNYMITLRRYTRPCEDHMFGLDMPAEMVAEMNDYSKHYFNLATAVTYMGEQTGNKLSDILKFDYGANWEDREGKTESLQSTDGGLAAQMKQRAGVSDDILSGRAGIGSVLGRPGQMIKSAAMIMGKGKSVKGAMAKQLGYEGNTYIARYGEELYGDVNVINKVKIRSRGLTFSNGFSLVFEYSLKSLKCVNPRVAMMDILSNFLVLTGNYGAFWGGATIFYGNRNIAPQYGDPDKLRKGDYGGYIKSLAGDVKEGFKNITHMDHINGIGDFFQALWNGIKSIGSGFIQGMVGNLLGGNIGVAGEGQAVPALLSGNPSGFWHLTIGNPLDPIAMMGNMAVTKTTVQFSDALGYDDFPTEIKFTVDMEHCQPRDNAKIENMFNGTKGRFYAFTNGDVLNAFKTVNSMENFQTDKNMENQERNQVYDSNGYYKNIPTDIQHRNKIIAGHTNG